MKKKKQKTTNPDINSLMTDADWVDGSICVVQTGEVDAEENVLLLKAYYAVLL